MFLHIVFLGQGQKVNYLSYCTTASSDHVLTSLEELGIVLLRKPQRA